MANTADKVIKIAEEQVGYLEKKSSSDLDSKTGNAGNNNYTKYARDMNKWVGSPFVDGYAWCCTFVQWCFVKAYGISEAKKLLGGWTAYCPTAVSYFKNMGRWFTNNPKVGDQIFFKNSSGVAGHTGIVYKVDSGYVYTIEGNTSGASGVIANGGGVCKKTYAINYTRILGYGRPNYSAEKNDDIQTASCYSSVLAGTYIATTNVNMRVGAGKVKKKITQIKKGESVKCYGYYNKKGKYKWLLCVYNGKTGYVCIKRLKKK